MHTMHTSHEPAHIFNCVFPTFEERFTHQKRRANVRHQHSDDVRDAYPHVAIPRQGHRLALAIRSVKYYGDDGYREDLSGTEK